MPERAAHPLTADVAIVGAGPAGSSAAIVAARAGLRTVVVDRARFPRDKCCGDGLTVGALRLLEQLGLDPKTIPSWTPAHEAVVSSPSRRAVLFPLPRGRGQFAAIARREELDTALVDVARTAGATVLDGVAVVGVTQDADDVSLARADNTTIRARYVIAADGMWSPVRGFLGLGPPDYRGEWHAFRQYFRGVSSRAERELMVWFEPDFLPGYAWSFPLGDGRANVGFGIHRGGSYEIGAMKYLWPDILARPHIAAYLGSGAEPESPHKAWPIPARIHEMVLAEGRVLFVGDAVAAPDPMTGEGIGQALATGGWAARAVIRAGRDAPLQARSAYEARVRRELVPDHRLANLLVRALRHRKGARAAVRVASLTPWTRRNFARWLFEDYPRAVLFTPGRWRPGRFTDSGAFVGGSSARNVAATSGS
jgi:geranylgeranyl reductase family protein